MNQLIHRALRFDRFTLDLARACARVGDQDIALRPKAFEVLRYLAENAGRLVPKSELFEAVWPDVIVSDASITQCIRELREKLGDNDHSLIKTVSRRGYLLDAAVTAETSESQSTRPAAPPPEGPPPQRDTPQRAATGRLQKLRLWLAAAAGASSVAGLAIYLFAWPVLHANPGHVSVAEHTPGLPQSRPTFKDCEECPDMVALPAGEFMMGSPEGERGREDVEGLPRRVVISKRFGIGRFEVTVDQFSAFVSETGTVAGDHCKEIVAFDRTSLIWGPPERTFREPGFDVTGSQPVVCVSWHEARAYAAWLRRRTGKPYRLPTESEWEYAARAGTRSSYSFGDDETALCAYARFADLGSRFGWRDACRSDTGTYGPLPVGSLKPNPWGIFDMHGNVWEWVEDCWTPNASEIPTDGSAFAHPGNCEMGAVRGGSWAAASRRVRSAMRAPVPITTHNYNIGFRVVLSLDR
ncbi:MAG TPA: SUMF1/EgtB/PvdO family nonheme iron enzyme [Xanthobacteraceae bacterium]|jgi:formylglycine-generating enzyme required for sulfatase activity